MKIFVNRAIKRLFLEIGMSMLVFVLFCALLFYLEIPNRSLCIILCALGMGIGILAFCYRYFREQDTQLENATAQIQAYLSGNRDARIVCDEEGELYRLFHEVNSLAAILNASAKRERESKQFLKNAISDISHQLKTPLAALNIYHGLMQEASEDSECKEFAVLSEKELERMERLVQNLLKLTKLDAGSVVFEKALENLADMMAEVELHFACRAKMEEKKLILDGPEDLALFCDRGWMTEAVENIVKNAFDHTREGDLIQVYWRKSVSMVQIIIKDNGSGIHPEDLHHIFKRFYRSRFSTDQQGIGLGLPLAKTIVEAHGGTIEADSELEKGTTFTITCCPTPTSWKEMGGKEK